LFSVKTTFRITGAPSGVGIRSCAMTLEVIKETISNKNRKEYRKILIKIFIRHLF
jgi:hypothetical protein